MKMWFLLTVAISFYSLFNVYGVPIGNERWKTPCGLLLTERPPFPSQKEIIQDMIVRIDESIGIVNMLRKRIANERIYSDILTTILDMLHVDGFEVEKATEEIISEAAANISQSHLKTYTQLSVAAIFLEQIRFDEEVYEHNTFPEITHSETTLYDTLCHMHMAIGQLEGSIENHQSRDIMSTELRTITNRSDRYARDYIIVKDISNTFKSLLVIHEAIFNEYCL